MDYINMTTEERATLIAERYGIIDYEIHGETMHYVETFPSGTWYCIINIETLQEKRKQLF